LSRYAKSSIKEARRRLLVGASGLVAALLSIVVPLWVFWNEANEAEGLRGAGLMGAPSVSSMVEFSRLEAYPLCFSRSSHTSYCSFSLRGQAEKLRWINGPSAILIGALSGWILYVTLERAYWDYYLYPKLKALEGYVYPQHRYAIFDALVIIWCLDGIAACVLLLRTAVVRHAVDQLGCRVALAFVIGFGILVIGSAYGMC